MMKLEVTITGNTREDLELALDDFLTRVGGGEVEGSDFNIAVDYSFVITNDSGETAPLVP